LLRTEPIERRSNLPFVGRRGRARSAIGVVSRAQYQSGQVRFVDGGN
jgi:hypothetical protein